MSKVHNPNTRSAWWTVAHAAQGLLLGGVIALQLWYTFDTMLRIGPFFPPPLIVPADVLIMFVLVIVHELGHLLAALAVGLPVLGIRVWPLSLTRQTWGPEVKLDFSNSVPVGFVLVSPVHGTALRLRMMLSLAGGPLANLLAGIGCLVLAGVATHLMPNRSAQVASGSWGSHEPFLLQNQASYWLNVVGFLSLWMCVSNLIPLRWRQWASDGAQLLSWLRSRPLSERDTIIRSLYTALRRGVRPKDWDAKLVRRLLVFCRGSAADAVANLYGYYHTADSGQYEEAGQLLDRALGQRTSCQAFHQAAILAEAAYFEACCRRNPFAARVWLKRIPPAALEKHTLLRAEAAVLLAEERYREAAAAAEAGLGAVPQSVDPGGSAAEAEWLRHILLESRFSLARGQVSNCVNLSPQQRNQELS